MNKILLTDCSPEVTQFITNAMGKKESIITDTAAQKRSLNEFKMVVLEENALQEPTVQTIKKIRYACNFRNIPIVLVKRKQDHLPVHPYIMAGCTEILYLQDPPAAIRQILQGYLTPNRRPLAEEMEYLQHFIQNTQMVLETMAALKAEFKEVYFSGVFRIFADVSGIIGLSGKAEGTVIMTCYWDIAKKIISQMMKVKEDEINAELIHDGIGELINMISGATKKNFVGTPYHFDLSLPTVVMGPGHQIGHPEDSNIAVLIFDVDQMSFALQVAIKPYKA
ncbi:MAG: chemotaxis protein CheX [Deltaproteobacteria bacterium]|nr:chemotaxis protein CheX [Deltaproteobacteria bacterium]